MTSLRLPPRWMALAGAAALTACPSSTEDDAVPLRAAASCGAPAPCGGDPTGAWRAADYCVEGLAQEIPGCPDGRLEFSGSLAMTADFEADGRYRLEGRFEGRIEAYFPSLCLGGRSCAEAQEGLNRPDEVEGEGGEEPLVWSCAEGAGGCDCAATVPDGFGDDAESGTWSVDGDAILTTPDDPEDDEGRVGFCVRDGRLTVTFEDDADGDDAGGDEQEPAPVGYLTLERR